MKNFVCLLAKCAQNETGFGKMAELKRDA